LHLPFGGFRVTSTEFAEGGFGGEAWSPADNFTTFNTDNVINITLAITITSKCIEEGLNRDVLTTIAPVTPNPGAGCNPSKTRCVCDLFDIGSSNVTLTQINVQGCNPSLANFYQKPGVRVSLRNVSGSNEVVVGYGGINETYAYLENITITDIYFNRSMPAILIGPSETTENSSVIANLTISDNYFDKTGSALSIQRVFCYVDNYTDPCAFVRNTLPNLGDPSTDPILGNLDNLLFGVYYDFQLSNLYSPWNDNQSIDTNVVTGTCSISCFLVNSSIYDIPIFRTVTSEIIIRNSAVSGSVWIPILILLAIIIFIILLIFIIWFINERSKADERKRAQRMQMLERNRSVELGTRFFMGNKDSKKDV